MIGTAVTTSRGNYRCPYCSKTWKRWDQEFIDSHITNNHLEEAIEEKYRKKEMALKNKNVLLENQNLELRRKLEVAQRPRENKTEYYNAVIFCTNCLKVSRAGMPKGVLVENVTCSNCGTRNIKLSANDPSWPI